MISRLSCSTAPTTRARIPHAVLAAALTAAFATLPAQAEERAPADVVKAQCSHCHGAPNVPAAPKPGDKAAWAPRMSHGLNALVMSAIRGHGGMPPRGGKADLTDGEIRAAILYMWDPSGASKPPAPKASTPAPVVAGQHRATAGGMDIYLGRISAAQMRAYPAGSAESKMHGGVPSGSGYWHVNVSVYDAATQAPVKGATVDFEYEQLGMGRERKDLEPMTMGGGTSYGAYVRLAPNTTYNFLVRVKKPGATDPVEVKFQDQVR
jgi:cytochrome c5